MSRAADERLDSGQELQNAERLRDIVVRTEAEAEDLVGLFTARGEYQNGNGAPFVAERPEHAITVHAGQHEVEHDEVWVDRPRLFHARDAVLRHRDRVAGDLEAIPKTVGEVGVVLDDQYYRALLRSRSALGHLRSKG